MSKLKVGIVGLPNVGKSTLFNALTKAGAASSNYPFCTIDPNVGVVDVTDPRLAVLSKMSNSEKIVYATMEFVDIAGLVEGASKGEGLGNQFLAHIRETDAIAHVVRCFECDEIVHVKGGIDPIGDVETINMELVLADLQQAQNSAAKLEKQIKGNRDLVPVLEQLKRVIEHLDSGKAVRDLEFTDEQQELLKPYPFLTAKRVLYVANVSEDDLPAMDNEYVQRLREYAGAENVISICSKLEAEISELDPQEQGEFLESVGLEETGLNRLVHASFDMLGLITYLTTGEMESRAWTIMRGATAVEAAAKIHTDISKGFIRAEVIAYADMVKHDGRNGAKEAGKLRAEGRDYIVQDGDVILFLHN
ncbi:MAG: Ribosome-binding ATPase YchF [Chlamydiales bacterium]|nr:Ribosome-binding ATPase YchF [Chlamydiales bacterium]MCH9635586.1 Ribosome-binding ATPase YchF [Chlamydiales bacterium]MCH9703204.1 redox-regulated ATPase YchF [Chlamydiota bacterium]